jgi:hypothetical protein
MGFWKREECVFCVWRGVCGKKIKRNE